MCVIQEYGSWVAKDGGNKLRRELPPFQLVSQSLTFFENKFHGVHIKWHRYTKCSVRANV
jgi:hypothetical protein